jgi:hypothetical protein
MAAEFKVLKVLKEEHKDDHNLIRLWIVKWNMASRPVLEKRRIWIDKHGDENTRKAVGLSLEDVDYITQNQEEISRILKGEQ